MSSIVQERLLQALAKVYYLPSYPFGEIIFKDLALCLPEFEWIKIETESLLEHKTILLDSNAPLHAKKLLLKSSNILAINPIWQKLSPEPIWLEIPLLRKSFLKRLQRFRSSSLVDSFLYPYTESPRRSLLEKSLQNTEVWHRLLKKQTSSMLSLDTSNQVYLLSNLEDTLREVEVQNSLIKSEDKWIWDDLPHSLLAMTKEHHLNLKQILLRLTQDKGL